MSVDRATVRRVARLARIRVEDKDLPKLEAELNSILHWIEQLNEVDVSKVEPLTRFRIRAWTKARRFPGVRWVNSMTRHGCPSKIST